MLALLALFLAAPLVAESPREVRGLWVVRTALVSPQTVDRVVDDAARAGINTLLVQVRGRGDAFYDSRLAPRSPLLRGQPADFDPLARLIQRAQLRGLEVHAWVNVLLVGGFAMPIPPGHAVEQHPEWLMVPKNVARAALAAKPAALASLIRRGAEGDPDVEGYYLSPSAPGVAEMLEATVREIVRGYPVRGLHLDFIRYPNPDYDWSQAALQGFARQQKTSGDPLAGPLADPDGWQRYRRETLTALAERLSKSARAERPQILVSAAVVPDQATALHARYQDWPDWLARGILDAACPMAYTVDSRIFRDQVAKAQTRIAPGQAVWAGVGAYRLALQGLVDRIALARGLGVAGVVLFSHEYLQPWELDRLRTEAFPGPAGAAPAMSLGASGSHPR
jgi:uncharacterized lipoprotein YddW (UPF0748 family)